MSDPFLPVPSLRLLVPPLQFLSATMWHMAKQKDVMNYGRLQEFVSMVTEAVPGLISRRQRAQLILGLRARLILELCKGSAQGDVDSQVIKSSLERFPVTCANTDSVDTEVKTTECTFIALVQSLLKDPIERAYFFQEVFPVEYGPQYDAALQVLMWELLSKLEKMLPAPDLKQTAAWLASAPSVLEEWVDSSPEELRSIFQHYKTLGLLKMTYGPSSTVGSCIMSALSVPPSQKTNLSIEQESIHNYANTLTPVTLAGVDHYSVVAYCTEVEVGASEADEDMMGSAEVQLQTDCYEEEIVAVSVDNATGEEAPSALAAEMSEPAGVAKALETLTKTFALRKASLGQDVRAESDTQTSRCDELGPRNEAEERQTNEELETGDGHVQADAAETNADLRADPNCEFVAVEEAPNVPSEASEAQQPDVRRSTRLQTKPLPSCQEMWKVTRTARESGKEPKMYKNVLTVILY